MSIRKKIKIFFGIAIVVGLIIIFYLIGSVSIELTFSQSDIEKIEMYHYEGSTAQEMCKNITKQEDINALYRELQSIRVKDKKKDSNPMTGDHVTRFVFVLSDGTEYDLEYYNSGVNSSISSTAGNFKYQTSANLEKYWTKLDYKLVEKEPEMLSIDEYNKKYAQKNR